MVATCKHGIAQVADQMAKYDLSLRDVRQEFLDKETKMTWSSLQKFVDKEKVSKEEMSETLSRIHPTLDLKEPVADSELIIDADEDMRKEPLVVKPALQFGLYFSSPIFIKLVR